MNHGHRITRINKWAQRVIEGCRLLARGTVEDISKTTVLGLGWLKAASGFSQRKVKLVLVKFGQGMRWMWKNHRGWIFSISTSLVILLTVGAVFLISGPKASTGIGALSVLGGFIWAVLILGSVFLHLRRYQHPLLVFLGILVSLAVIAGLAVGTVMLYTNDSSIWWMPIVVVVLVGLILMLRIWGRKLFPAKSSGSTPTAPIVPPIITKTTPVLSYPKRTGPPGLFIIIIVVVDAFVLVQQITSPAWQWPFFNWPATAHWLRSWQLWFVVVLTAVTFFADWGPANRPNAVRRTAANTVSAVFVLGIIIVVLAALTAAASLVQWVPQQK